MSATGSRQTGFSLTELLVVLVILGVVVALVPPALDAAMQSARLKAGAREVATALRQARGQAVHQGQEARFLLDTRQRRYRIGERAPRALHEGLRLELTTAEVERVSRHAGGIRFYPDGSSTGGRIVLSGRAGSFRVDVHWLTGRVQITP